MVRAVGINHVAFEVRDLDEALAWYGRFFDLRMRGRRPTMAWIDLGDQFIALSETAAPARDTHRHVGLVVDDREALRAALRDAGYDVPGSGSLRVHDPSGNQLEIVDYREVQFTKAPAVLRGMEIADIDKTDGARAELAAKGMLDA
jgi:catechol 2,3-dioxygenase-like lactoylglutathione lyase family enzyme